MSRIPAPLLSLTAAVSWGAMFPIAGHALPHVDAFNLTAIRYGVASLIFIALLVRLEGRGALRYEGRFREALWLGSLGFAGFNLLAYVALEHTEPQNAALIIATAPLVTQIVKWLRDGERPSGATLTLTGVALFGVALVITRGDVHTQVQAGDVLVLGAVVGWVLYTLGAQRFGGWSPLRYTALTAPAGTLTILAATAIADAVGWKQLPSAADVGAAWLPIAFIIVFGAVVAVIAWNAGVKRLGPANGALFMNLVPITTFAIQIGGGYDPRGAEIGGALLTVSALVAANLLARRVGAERSVLFGRYRLSRAGISS
jgi:drug/metabolite transporter (DMT)-like permease